MPHQPKGGEMKSKEDIVGHDTFPESLFKFFNGENFGKLVFAGGRGVGVGSDFAMNRRKTSRIQS